MFTPTSQLTRQSQPKNTDTQNEVTLLIMSEPSRLSDHPEMQVPTKLEVDCDRPCSPVITITPASLTFTHNLPTPPISPTAAAAPKPILKTRKSTTPISLYTHVLTPSPPCDPLNPHPSLRAPLRRHLALLHPSTPTQIVEFCAVRLLSKDRPHGYEGDWTPIYEPDQSGVKVDLAAAGLGLDAPRAYAGAQSDRGEGRGTDKRLEGMYAVARESWGLLESKSPGVNKL